MDAMDELIHVVHSAFAPSSLCTWRFRALVPGSSPELMQRLQGPGLSAPGRPAHTACEAAKELAYRVLW